LGLPKKRFIVCVAPTSIDVKMKRSLIVRPANGTSEKRGRTYVPGLLIVDGVLAGKHPAPEQPWRPGPSLAF